MKKLTKVFGIFFATFLSLCFYSCANQPTAYSLSFVKFNTSVRVEVYDKPISKTTENQITTLLTDIDSELSTTLSSSKVYAFNGANAYEQVTFSPTAISIIANAKDYYALTGGKFNFAVYPLTELWGFSATSYPVFNFTPPSDGDISTAKALCNVTNIVIDGNQVYKTADGVKMDLGGLAKGYAVSKVTQALKSAGHTNGYVNIGGSSMHILALSGKDNYLSIRHPRANGTILSFKQSYVNDVAVSTSGDYERYYEQGGKHYSHIIDCASGKPTDTGIISATVLKGDPCLTDALTTALCLTKRSELASVFENFPDLKFFVFYQSGDTKELITNEKQGDNFTLLDDTFKIVTI